MKGTNLSDGKSLHGKGRLTDKVMDELQQYYGKAIRSNGHDLKAMQRAIWATYFHRLLMDERPSHQLCPEPPDTWCKYRIAEFEGKLDEFKHKKALPEAVLMAIKPIYRDLSSPDLLNKCLHGQTQNVNESFNNVVWTRIPKSTFVGKKTLEIGVWDSVITFNDGNVGRLRTVSYTHLDVYKRQLPRCEASPHYHR